MTHSFSRKVMKIELKKCKYILDPWGPLPKGTRGRRIAKRHGWVAAHPESRVLTATAAAVRGRRDAMNCRSPTWPLQAGALGSFRITNHIALLAGRQLRCFQNFPLLPDSPLCPRVAMLSTMTAFASRSKLLG
jgi:hypothetical protein